MLFWRQSTKNTKVEFVLRGDLVKDDFGSYAVFIEQARFISIANDNGKGHGYHFQIAGLRWTSSRRSICLYPDKNGGCSQVIENSQIGMSRHLDSSTTTQMAKSWSSVEDPVVPLEISMVIFWHNFHGKTNFNILLKYLLEKVSNWECLFEHREKDHLNLCVWMTSS